MEPQKVVTIFKDTMVQDFVIRIKEELLPEEGSVPLAEDYFFMMLSPKSEKLSKFYLQIFEGRIYMRNKPDSAIIAYIDIGYARLKLLKAAELAGKQLHGIRFIKNKNYEEIYHESLESIVSWFTLLKRWCVLSKFREQYSIKNVIGKGNFAKVYITTKIEDNRDYAVKIFDKQLILQDEFERKCLLYELTMMREVSHPSLLEILEIYEGDNNIYCLGKLYSGDSLSTVINDKKQAISEAHVKTMAYKMLQALSYLESKSIIHRDLKPENIVFSSKGSLDEPVLIDLGFATFERDFRLLFSRCGTPGYVAPEVLHDKDYTCKADIFSLGIILYMMVTRTNPFDHASYRQLIQNNLNGEVDLQKMQNAPMNPSKELVYIVSMMLTVEPKIRPKASQMLTMYKKAFKPTSD